LFGAAFVRVSGFVRWPKRLCFLSVGEIFVQQIAAIWWGGVDSLGRLVLVWTQLGRHRPACNFTTRPQQRQSQSAQSLDYHLCVMIPKGSVLRRFRSRRDLNNLAHSGSGKGITHQQAAIRDRPNGVFKRKNVKYSACLYAFMRTGTTH